MDLYDLLSKKNFPDENTPGESGGSMIDPETFFRQSFLLNEAKFRHQPSNVKRSSNEEPMTLGYILKELLSIAPSEIGTMTIVSRSMFGPEDTQRIDSPADVLAYKPFDALLHVSKTGNIIPKPGMNVVLVISYRPGDVVFENKDKATDKSNERTDNSIIMFLRLLGPFVVDTAYMRVSVMIPNFSPTDDFRNSHTGNAPFTTSFVLSYDVASPGNRLTKYEEIEAALCSKANNPEELDEEERIVLEGITYSKTLGYDLGYGRWLVTQNRFADALAYLLRAYDFIKNVVVTNYTQVHKLFSELSFCIGFCFNELEQFDRAYYFLSQISQNELNRTNKYAIELINSMVNAKNPNAYSILWEWINEFQEGKRPCESEEDEAFYCFLARRMAYLLCEYKMWDQARELLMSMKDHPLCHDFVMAELAYIDRMTGQLN